MNRRGRKPGAQPSLTSETALASMATDVADAATEATLAAIKAKTDQLSFAAGVLQVSSSGGAATGGLTDTQLRAAPVPVLGPVTDAQIRATPVPVSGTVATGGLTDTQLRASAVPVSGAFFPGTQPVSGPLTDVQLRASAVPMSAAALPLPAGAATDATLALIKAKTDNLDVLLSTRTKPADAQHVIVDASAAVAVTGPLTDTQLRAVAVLVKNLKDAGRNVVNYFMAAGIAATAVEVMQSLTGYKGGVAVGATATPAVVTGGKTYRLTAIVISFQSLATVTAASIRLRCNLTGVAVVGSPLVASWVIGSLAAVAGVTTTLVIPLPDGTEFPAGAGLAIGVLGLSTVGAAAASGFVTVALQGFEY